MQNEAFSQVILTKSIQSTSRGRSNCSQIFFKIGALKNFSLFTEKHLCWSFVLINSKQVFSCEYCEIFKNGFFKEHLWWLLLKRSYWTPPQGFCILMNVYEFFRFSTLGSISQYGNTSWAMHFHLYMTQLAGMKQFSTTYQN